MTHAIIDNPSAHLFKLYELQSLVQQTVEASSYELNGEDLHIAEVVAVAKYGCTPVLTTDRKVLDALQESVDVLFDHLAKGWYVYGVNTGFGGSADTRTEQVVALQSALMQLTQTGILARNEDGSISGRATPPSWVRAAMVVRCNSSLRGHSAVSLPIINTMMDLLKHHLTPVVPLLGSVSASGDLMPLAYVAGSIEGNPGILLEKNGMALPSIRALETAGIKPIVLGPKEGLGLINGTASSAGLGALVIAQSHQLAFLTQLLTAAAVEALHGSSESFHPFIAESRPHPGQIECARNIKFFLSGSRLARDVIFPKDRRREDLVQDRYSLRSAPQWIGPQLEDLLLADQQVSIELNSSCDNPLVDSSVHEIYYGCNFQAASVSSAVEKARLAAQMFGRILFAQTTEMIDPHLSGGLPANLAADDPSLSFTMKGVDINMAAYMAELAYLASPLSPHAQAAEMHNQSINSMALASARLSMDALDVLAKMAACSVYVACQALDLRTLHNRFLAKVEDSLATVATNIFAAKMEGAQLISLCQSLRSHIKPSWNSTVKADIEERCELLSNALVLPLLNFPDCSVTEISQWRDTAPKAVLSVWRETFELFCNEPHTAQCLGSGSQALYEFVRHELKVPFHEGFIEHPTLYSYELHGRPKRIIGEWISIIYDALQSGRLIDRLLPLVEDLLHFKHV